MSSIKRWIMILLGVGIAIVALAIETRAQSTEGFLYGKVYTDNATYTGPLRWGTEEVLWTDLFNAAKTTDQYKKLVPEKQANDNSWLGIDWSFGSIWEDKIVPHQFVCQFGNLSAITVQPNNEIKVRLKNGSEFRINGEGYNDLDSDIHVIDPELGVVTIDWQRIKKIEFMETPARLETIFGQPIYGSAEGIRREKFTGYIVWDNDERLLSDKLDGDSDDGRASIKFGDIRRIEKQANGSKVVLKSGRDLYLTGTNDVNSENRGIFIVTPDIGIVEMPWEGFRSITFSDAPVRSPAYSQFEPPAYLYATVSTLDGEDLSGRIIFDIDEVLDIELIEGRDNDIKYNVLLRNIKKIAPKNNDYATIELRNGNTLLLGDGQDVSARNGGVLVFVKGKKEPKYVSWKKINEIVFN